MTCVSNKIDSNVTGLSFAEEECLKLLPGVDGVDAIWYGLEPNSYSDFGGQLTTTARAPIDPSRQNKKGVVTDLAASGGFNLDLTKTNTQRLMQGFFFADAREKATNAPIHDATLVEPITAVTTAADQYAATSFYGTFHVGDLIFAQGFGILANNGLKHVATVASGLIGTTENLTDESSPPSTAKIEVVGHEFAASDATISIVSGIPQLNSAAVNLTTLGLIPGEWIFIGGDSTPHQFVHNVGYARCAVIASGHITFDDTTFVPQAETATALTIQIYFGNVLRNENASNLIKRRSYNLERQLGQGANGTQAEYIEGAVANEFKLNIPTADKLTCDMSFVGADHTTRSGDTGDEIKLGTRIAAKGEDALNSTSNLYRIKMSLLDPSTTTPDALFAFVTEGNISISNGVKPNKAAGVLGAMDTSAGNFTVAGSVTAYFATVAAIRAVRNNGDVGLSIIAASKNSGFVYDIPLISLGGGRLTIAKDEPIMVPLDTNGAENPLGYSMLQVSFSYLPTLAMPD